MSEPRDRRVEIDALKTAGILTIVLIHSMRTYWDPSISTLEVWIGHATRFGVPAFLCASGFLYATTSPVPLTVTAGRARRILVPYLVASLAAQLFRYWRGQLPETGAIWSDLLIGATFGPFYYVFVIAMLLLVTPGFAHLSRRTIAICAGVSLATQWPVDTAYFGTLPLAWHLRNPLLWWPYFLLGWSVRLYATPLASFVERRRPVLVPCLIASVGLLPYASTLGGTASLLVVRTAAWLDVYAILALIAVATHGLPRSPAWLRFLSDATYAIYLFHLFFLMPVRDHLALPEGHAELGPIALPWLAGLLGSLLLVVAARALLGRSSRNWIGA